MYFLKGEKVIYRWTKRTERWKSLNNEEQALGTSLVVQGLSLRAPNAGGLGLIPGQGTRSHMRQLRSVAATYIKATFQQLPMFSLPYIHSYVEILTPVPQNMT